MRARFHLHRLVPCLLALQADLLGCSPPAPPLPDQEMSFGGASFVIWPLPTGEDAGPSADNPWLSGDLTADPGPASGGQTSTGPAEPTTSGGSGMVPSGPASTGGSSSVENPESAETPAPAMPAQLRFRAYVESTSAFKGLLIEHVGGDPSTACAVELYSNGSSEVWRSLELPAGIVEGDRVTVCVAADAAVCSTEVSGSAYNGNDALVLRCDGRIEDIFGVVGIDPGKGWAGAGYDGAPVTTVDQGLWRCGSGSPSLRTGFDLAQWVAWDWGSDPSWHGPACPEAGWGGAGAGDG